MKGYSQDPPTETQLKPSARRLAQHMVRQVWQISEMATRRAGDFPADSDKDL